MRRRPTEPVEVLLFQRSHTDPHFPDQWHTPGAMIVTTDATQGKSFGETWRRLRTTELPGVDYGDNQPVEAGAELVTTPRGASLLVVHYLVLRSRTVGETGKLFRVDNLPAETVECHRDVIIPRAVAAFERDTRT